MVSARLFRVALVSAALLWLVALAGVRAETPVTFKGSVFMADGFVDPADVKIVLTNNEGDEVRESTAFGFCLECVSLEREAHYKACDQCSLSY